MAILPVAMTVVYADILKAAFSFKPLLQFYRLGGDCLEFVLISVVCRAVSSDVLLSRQGILVCFHVPVFVIVAIVPVLLLFLVVVA